MRGGSRSRRRFLHRGVATTATMALAGLSGCSAIESVIDGSGMPAYATWIPAPERISDSETQPSGQWYMPRFRDFDELEPYLQDHGDSYASAVLSPNGKFHPVLEADLSEVGRQVYADTWGLSVLEVDRTADEMVEAYRTPESGGRIEEPFERIGEYEGYQLMSDPHSEWVVGVTDGTVVEAWMAQSFELLRDKRDVVKRLIDARNGEGRYIDDDDLLDEVVRRLGDGMVGSLLPTLPASRRDHGDQIAGGYVSTDAETNNAKRVLVFETTAEAKARAENPVPDRSGAWADRTVSHDGRIVTITGTDHLE